MKYNLGLIFILLMSGGCKSGNIDVTPLSDTPSVIQSKASLKPETLSPSIRGSSVFFNSFAFFDNNKVQTSGIGFLSDKATTTRPYAFNFPVDSRAMPIASFVPWNNGVIFIKALDPNRDAISFTEIPDLETEELYSHSSHIISVFGSEDKHWLGWIDDQGIIFLWHETTKNISQLSLPSFKAKSLQILSTPRRLVVVGTNIKAQINPVSEILIFNLSENPTEITEINAMDAQLSGHGKWIALTQPDDSQNSLIILNLQNPDQKFQIAEGIKGQSFQAKWSGDEFLAYILARSPVEGDLRIASVSEKKSTLISHIVTPYPLSQIACPSWRGTTLFYGSSFNDKLSILKAKKQSGEWRSSIFASPPSTNKGYGCPNGERNNP